MMSATSDSRVSYQDVQDLQKTCPEKFSEFEEAMKKMIAEIESDATSWEDSEKIETLVTRNKKLFEALNLKVAFTTPKKKIAFTTKYLTSNDTQELLLYALKNNNNPAANQIHDLITLFVQKDCWKKEFQERRKAQEGGFFKKMMKRVTDFSS